MARPRIPFDDRTLTAIDRIAENLGVPRVTRQKWRERAAVPPAWQIRIVLASGGLIGLGDFDVFSSAMAERNARRRQAVA